MASLISAVSNAGGCSNGCFTGLAKDTEAKSGSAVNRRAVSFTEGADKHKAGNGFNAAPPQLVGVESSSDREASLPTNNKHTKNSSSKDVVIMPSSLSEFQKQLDQLNKDNEKLKKEKEDLSQEMRKSIAHFENKNKSSKNHHHSDDSDDGDGGSSHSSNCDNDDAISEEGDSVEGDDDMPIKRSFMEKVLAKTLKRAEKGGGTNGDKVVLQSALGWRPALQVLAYALAAGGVIFVLVAPAFEWGKPAHRRLQGTGSLWDFTGQGNGYDQYLAEDFGVWDDDKEATWRRLNYWRERALNEEDHSAGHDSTTAAPHSAAGAGHDSASDHSDANHDATAGHDTASEDADHDAGVKPHDLVDGHSSGGHSSGGHSSHEGGTEEGSHQLVVNIAYCTVSAGFIAIMVHLFDQPLLLGYILGGVLVGPIGLKLIESAVDINTISELGLILLLFMIGLELDISELLKMGKVVIITGSIQFPICAGIHIAIFSMLAAMGISFGTGMYSTMYMGVCCAISSTMIVVKLLGQKLETDTATGRLTIGILIFQDMWAIIVMAIQPNLASPEILGILQTFGMMGALLAIAFAYAKYVLPAVFQAASTSMELLLILSMSWCFFICCIALLPQFNLSMELAALIAGVSMATFPYSAELNGKIKYIRDYFITLYFCSLGMQIPSPSIEAIGKALITCVVVLLVRWIGLFLVVEVLERDDKLAVVATMNLSEVSEFGLVLCSIGKKFGHVENDTFTIMIWTFSILAVSASYFIKYNNHAYVYIHSAILKCRGIVDSGDEDGGHSDHGHSRDIVLLGFSKIANALITEIQDRCPSLLPRLHVIGDSMKFAKRIEKKGVTFKYGDVGNVDVLQHCMPHGQDHVKLVIITQPDSQLGKHTNTKLMMVVKSLPCCKEAKMICTAEHTSDVERLYQQGAAYVLKMVKLSAERLCDMLESYAHGMGTNQFTGNQQLQTVLMDLADADKMRERRASEVDNANHGNSKKAMGQ